MMNDRGQLTQYREGSVQELWAISFPLMFSVFSISAMTFVNRLILSKYDVTAMNAAVVAGFVFSIFQYGTIGIATISEVLVGQLNGAKKYGCIGESVWQMIWFSLMTSVLFIPLGLLAGPFLIPNSNYVKDGIHFFTWMMIFGPIFPLITALSSFFIGRGQMKLVMASTIFSNVLNVIFGFILIFGVENIIPALGARGAAIATGISQIVQMIVLFVVFLNSDNQRIYKTCRWQFKPAIFTRAFKIGLPSALSSMIELLAWSFLSRMLTNTSEMHITIFSIGDSFFNLFAFIFWGLQKGITTLVANYLGANRDDMIPLCLYSGIKVILVTMLIFTIPLLIFPEALAQQFLAGDVLLKNEELIRYSVSTMRWLWVYFLLDAVAWLFWGALTAGGDTKFVMLTNSISVWCVAVVPCYLLITYLDGGPMITWGLCILYVGVNAFCYFLRYRGQRWNAVSIQAYT